MRTQVDAEAAGSLDEVEQMEREIKEDELILEEGKEEIARLEVSADSGLVSVIV